VKLGPEAVQKFRGGLHERPPPLTVDSPFYPGKERRHADLSLSQLPLTESLYDCMKRSYPLYETRIKDDLRSGRNVMVVGEAERGAKAGAKAGAKRQPKQHTAYLSYPHN
jgi:2,3-bisphosphoglycerate-dependent phosphoglycerate mutase